MIRTLFAIALLVGTAFASNVIPPGSTTTTLTVAWVPPTKNVDGSAITGTLTYNAYWGTSCVVPLTSKMNTTPIAGTSYLVTNAGPGFKCFAVTAVVNGVESAQSAMARTTVTAATIPNPPSQISVN